ncbi:MAG: XdhC/CoxI family protein [Lentisphaerota bacterium]
MNNIPAILLEWAREGKSWAEAILVKAQHSSPLPPGARLFVNEKGEMHGAISMGCVENDVREHLLKLLKGGPPRILHYGAANEFSFEVGLSCGGEIDVLLRVQPKDDVWRDLAAGHTGQQAILLTCLTEPYTGRQRICYQDGKAAGSLGAGDLDQDSSSGLTSLRTRGGSECLKLGEFQVFAECLETKPTLAIVGASPIATALCSMAVLAGFRVIVVDPRSAYAHAQLFPDAEKVVHQWPEEGLQAMGIHAAWFVAVLAHDAKLDVPALATALRSRCRYIGLLGSRKTQESRRCQLREMGLAPEEIQKIHGPIGLSLGALEPAEIAVSILAEMIEVRRGG